MCSQLSLFPRHPRFVCVYVFCLYNLVVVNDGDAYCEHRRPEIGIQRANKRRKGGVTERDYARAHLKKEIPSF